MGKIKARLHGFVFHSLLLFGERSADRSFTPRLRPAYAAQEAMKKTGAKPPPSVRKFVVCPW
jgi:hypothetical protein